jgi:hypothetical protein
MKFWLAMGLLVAAAPAVASAPDAVDVSGTWHISGEVSGQSVDDVCTLKQADTALTGTCNSMGKTWDTKGKVDGKTVSFTHDGQYQGDKITLTYTGKLASDGSLSGTLDVDPYAVTGSFAAKKDAAAAPAAGLQ